MIFRSPFSKKIVIGLGRKKDSVSIFKKKYEFISNPVRKQILELRKKFSSKFNINKINILIIGGSQGANILGENIPEALNLLPKEIKNKIIVHHQCSKNNIETIKKKYSKMKLRFNCKVFFNNLPYLMSNSNLVISRAGASSLSEISSLGKTSILIPYKYAKNNHQSANAEWFKKHGASEIINEEDFSIIKLHDTIKNLLNNYKKLEKMSKNSFLLSDKNCLKKLANLILKIK